MADITIIVRNAATGAKSEVELPDDVQMNDLLPVLAENLQIEDAGELRLLNKTQNFEFNSTDTLSDRNTKAGDVCLLSYEVVQGR